MMKGFRKVRRSIWGSILQVKECHGTALTVPHREQWKEYKSECIQ